MISTSLIGLILISGVLDTVDHSNQDIEKFSQNGDLQSHPRIALDDSVYSPLHWYKLDEKLGSTVYDSGSDPQNGINNGASINQNGYHNESYLFDDNDDYINCGSIGAYSEITTSFWMKPNQVANYDSPLTLRGLNETDDYSAVWRFEMYNSGIFRLVFHDAMIQTSSAISPDSWYFVAATWDGTTASLYLNNSLIGTASPTLTISWTELLIGVAYGPSGDLPLKYYSGLMDDVRIYDFALSAPQVDFLFNEEINTSEYGSDNRVLDLKLDEGSGSTAFDQTPYENDGSINGATWTTGIRGNALEFLEADDYIDCGSDSSLDLVEAITVESWIKVYETTYENQVIATRWLGGSANSFAFELQPDGRTLQTNMGTLGTVVSSIAISFDEWYHVAWTIDGSDAYIFINGIQTGYKSISGTLTTTNAPLFIGSHDNSTHRSTFRGKIDEFRMYSQALNQSEILQRYHLIYTDNDGDGYSNEAEIIMGTNPLNPKDPASPDAPWLQPMKLGHFITNTTGEYEESSNYYPHFEIQGDIAYVTDKSNGLFIVDISDPTEPEQLGHLPSFSNSSFNGLDYYNDTLYIADRINGLLIVNVSSPANPGIIYQNVSRNDTCVNLLYYNSTIFLFTLDNGIEIYNVEDPSEPIFIDNIENDPYFSVNLQIKNDLLFFSGGYYGYLYFYDISDVTDLSYNGVIDDGEITSFDIIGDAIFTTHSTGKIQIFDQPSDDDPEISYLFQMDSSLTDFIPYHIDVRGEIAYIAGNMEGFIEIDVSDHSNPILLSSNSFSGGKNIVVTEDLIATIGKYNFAVEFYDIGMDSDDDGLSDGSEKFIYLTNTDLQDTDGDGFLDGEEIKSASSPLLSSSTPSTIELSFTNVIEHNGWRISVLLEFLPNTTDYSTFSISIQLTILEVGYGQSIQYQVSLLDKSGYSNLAGNKYQLDNIYEDQIASSEDYIGTGGAGNFSVVFDLYLNLDSDSALFERLTSNRNVLVYYYSYAPPLLYQIFYFGTLIAIPLGIVSVPIIIYKKWKKKKKKKAEKIGSMSIYGDDETPKKKKTKLKKVSKVQISQKEKMIKMQEIEADLPTIRVLMDTGQYDRAIISLEPISRMVDKYKLDSIKFEVAKLSQICETNLYFSKEFTSLQNEYNLGNLIVAHYGLDALEKRLQKDQNEKNQVNQNVAENIKSLMITVNQDLQTRKTEIKSTINHLEQNLGIQEILDSGQKIADLKSEANKLNMMFILPKIKKIEEKCQVNLQILKEKEEILQSGTKLSETNQQLSELTGRIHTSNGEQAYFPSIISNISNEYAKIQLEMKERNQSLYEVIAKVESMYTSDQIENAQQILLQISEEADKLDIEDLSLQISQNLEICNATLPFLTESQKLENLFEEGHLVEAYEGVDHIKNQIQLFDKPKLLAPQVMAEISEVFDKIYAEFKAKNAAVFNEIELVENLMDVEHIHEASPKILELQNKYSKLGFSEVKSKLERLEEVCHFSIPILDETKKNWAIYYDNGKILPALEGLSTLLENSKADSRSTLILPAIMNELRTKIQKLEGKLEEAKKRIEDSKLASLKEIAPDKLTNTVETLKGISKQAEELKFDDIIQAINLILPELEQIDKIYSIFKRTKKMNIDDLARKIGFSRDKLIDLVLEPGKGLDMFSIDGDFLVTSQLLSQGISNAPTMSIPKLSSQESNEVSEEPEVSLKQELKVIREFEYIAGQVRFKVGFLNQSPGVLTNIKIDFIIPDALKWITHDPQVYVRRADSIIIPKLSLNEKKSLNIYLEPISCMNGPINATISFFNAQDQPKAIPMTPKIVGITCPIFFTEEEANPARVRSLYRRLTNKDRKLLPLRNEDDLSKIFNLMLTTVSAHHVKLVSKNFSEDDKYGEALFYGVTKVKKNKMVITIIVNGEDHLIEVEVAGDDEEAITALLAELENQTRTLFVKESVIESGDQFQEIRMSVLMGGCPFCGGELEPADIEQYQKGKSIQCEYCDKLIISN